MPYTDRSKQRAAAARYAKNARQRALAKLGPLLCPCGYDDERALTIDHKVWTGPRRSGYQLAREVLLHPVPTEAFQILCFNCNWIKEHERRRVEGRQSESKRASRGGGTA